MELSAPSRKYPAETRYQQTEVGLIPADWAVCKVEEAFAICNQLRLPLSRATRSSMSGQYPYYGPTGPQDWINEFRLDGEYALIGEDGDHFLKWKTQPMTLLVQGRFNVNNHAHVVQGAAGNHTDWFRWFFANRDITQFLTRQGASRYKLTKATLACLPCAIPSPNEQRAISGALTDADVLIDSLEQLLTKKRQIKQGAMQELLTGKRRLPGFSAPVATVKLGTVCKMQSGGTPPATQPSFFDGPHHWVAISDITKANKYLLTTDRSLSDAGLDASPAQIFPKGTVLYAMYASVGECCIATMEVCTSQAILAMQPTACLDAEYLYYWFCSSKANAKSAVQQGTQGNLNKGIVQDMSIRLPDIQEQRAIANVLSDMDSDVAAAEDRFTKARALKQAMAQALLTGRIRLVEPSA